MKKLALVSLAALSVTAAFAGQATPIQYNGPRTALKPLNVAKVDAQGRLVGPWIPFSAASNDFDPNTIIFDQFEADPTGIGAPGDFRLPVFYGNGTRVFFGPGYRNVDFVADVNAAPGYGNQAGTRLGLNWWQNVPGEQLIIVLRSYDNFNTSAPAASGFVDGIALDYGTVMAAGGYYDNVDLQALNISGLGLAADGTGAIRGSYLSAITPNPVYSTTVQPMLWVIKSGYPETGTSSNLQWDDDAPYSLSFGDFTGFDPAAELYSYSFGAFPATNVNSEPYGAALSFYTDANVAIVQGEEFVGNFASLFASDDDKFSLFNDPFTLTAEISYTGNAGIGLLTSISTVTVDTEVSVDRGGLAFEATAANQDTTGTSLLGGGSAPISDTSYTFVKSGAAADLIVSSVGKYQVNLKFQPINDEDPATDGWLHNVDRLIVTVQ